MHTLQKTTPPWLAPGVIRAFKEREGVAPLVDEIGDMIGTIYSMKASSE